MTNTTTPSDIPTTPVPMFGAIYTVPIEEFAAITRRVARKDADVTPRKEAVMRWPFADMEVGQRVHIDPALAPRAREVLLTYGRTGKRFAVRTLWDAFEVTRIADRISRIRADAIYPLDKPTAI